MEIVSSIPLELYHSLCWEHSCYGLRIIIPQSEMVRVGAIIFCPSSTKSFDRQGQIVAFPEPVSLHYDGWKCSYTGLTGKLLDNGWTRYAIHIYRARCPSDHEYNSFSIDNERFLVISMKIYCGGVDWLSQANHIFGQLHANSNHHNYGQFREFGFLVHTEYLFLETVYIHRCDFQLWISLTGPDVPSGYLFFCPREDLQVGPSSLRWPDCPAYWSCDPDGLDPIDTEEAARLGYLTIELRREVRFRSWRSHVYTGLRQFHEAKGLDPDSQELARHLGRPLFKLADPPLPCGAVPFTYAQLSHANSHIHLAIEPEDFYEEDDDLETPDPLTLGTPNISDKAEDMEEKDELHLSAL
jgi:hypothetical protein